MSGIGIITNPHSKLNKRNPNRTAILGYILGEKGSLEVTNTLDELARVAREFRERGIQLLAINGGDGTICRTLTAFIKEYGSTPLPRVALLRGGTINVLANNLGIRGTPEQVLFRLIEAHSAESDLKTISITSIAVEGNYGFLFGNGVGASFLKEYYKRKSGPTGAAMWCMATYFSRFFGARLYDRVIQDYVMSLSIDGKPPLSHSSTAIFCSTLKKMPLGYPLFRQLDDHKQHFECASFTFAARDAVWQLPVIMIKRTKGPVKGKLSFLARSVTIAADKPFDYTLDGELYVSRSPQLDVKIGPDIEFVAL